MKNLPADFISFLELSESLVLTMTEGEVRRAEFLSLDELEVDHFLVESEGYDDEGEALASEEFEGYSLLKTVDGYEPDGMLVWFPALKEFGNWDCDHLSLITFPDVTWSQIIEDPTWFINGQWYPDRIAHRKVSPKQIG